MTSLSLAVVMLRLASSLWIYCTNDSGIRKKVGQEGEQEEMKEWREKHRWVDLLSAYYVPNIPSRPR